MKFVAAITLGIAASIALVHHHHPTTAKLVPEDASAPLRRIAIHYAPNADSVALGIWKQLFAVLPASVEVEVEVAKAADFNRLRSDLESASTPNLERFHPIVVGMPITTWARDRYAALDNETILAPPRVESAFADRAGDASSAVVISHVLYHREPSTAGFAFEGGDLAATSRFVFADANLAARNLARGAEVDRPMIEREITRRFSQELVWLGEQPGAVPRHHIMMYMMPLDDSTVAVGDVRAGMQLLAREPAGDTIDLDDVELQAARFDQAAAILVAHGFKVVRVPALVLDGGGSFVTYTNALFDRRGDTRVVYMPTYALPVLDLAAQHFYEARGFEVHPIDVSSIYKLDGSLGCLVNVLARG